MLRIILRHTHNALLLACILLLICSLERLCRYDYAQLEVASSAQPDGLQVDNFVFWGGIPAWEHHRHQNPFPVLDFINKAMSSWGRSRSGVIAEEYLNVPDTALPLVEAKNMLRRQVGNAYKKQHNETSQSSEKSSSIPQEPKESPSESATFTTTTTEIGTEKDTPSLSTSSNVKPKVGFLLQLSTCDRDEVVRWYSVWSDRQQGIDQPFLFAVLLPPSVEGACISELEAQWLATSKIVVDSLMKYRVFKHGRISVALQSCHRPEVVLDKTLGGLDELLYYDSSFKEDTKKLPPTPSVRQFLSGPAIVPSFRCVTGEPEKPAFCNDETIVRDCPRFQYVPSLKTNEVNGTTVKPVTS